jgi:hypothetical protein
MEPFKPPFRLYRPIKLATTLLNGARANIAASTCFGAGAMQTTRSG